MPRQAGVGGALKVSVIVPVFNPGRYLEPCIESILGQTLPANEFEAIFVDDGSTDASPARLDALAASHRNVRVIHQPNSGWPGKPRNVGIEAARGSYVYFVDHDDAIGVEALARLYAFAERNGSDVVIGKMAGRGRPVPRMLFLESRDRATLEDSGIIGALTPHKFFRRSFLDEHGIRFPEGRRRLEDHVFVLRAYFAARVISVLADYTCYYEIAPGWSTNAASGAYDPTGRFDPKYYFTFLREVLDIVEAHTEPGSLRDRLLRRFVTNELLGRLARPAFIVAQAGARRLVLDEIRSVVERYIPESVDRLLPPSARMRLWLVRRDRLEPLVSLARTEAARGLAARVRDVNQEAGGQLHVAAEAELVENGQPLRFETREDRLLLPARAPLAAAVPAEVRSMPLPPPSRADLIARRRPDGAEVIRPARTSVRLVPEGGSVRIVESIELSLDPASPDEGHGLRSGHWDLRLRVELGGYAFDTALRQPAGLGRSRALAIQDGVLARTGANWDLHGRLPGIANFGPVGQLVALATASRAGRRLLRVAGRYLRAERLRGR